MIIYLKTNLQRYSSLNLYILSFVGSALMPIQGDIIRKRISVTWETSFHSKIHYHGIFFLYKALFAYIPQSRNILCQLPLIALVLENNKDGSS